MKTYTEQQLFDYMFCPVLYDIKYNKKINIQDPIFLKNILNSITNYFYLNVLNGKIPTLNMLKTKFDSLCETYKEILTNKQVLDGWGLIYIFYHWAIEERISVIETDLRYSMTYNTNIINGVFNPISLNKNKDLEFLIVNFSNKIPDQLYIDMRLKYTLDILAFNSSFKDQKIKGIRMHHIKTNKDIYSYRTEPDFHRLKSSIEGIAQGISNNAFYPRETNMCDTCSAKQYCRYWSNINI